MSKVVFYDVPEQDRGYLTDALGPGHDVTLHSEALSQQLLEPEAEVVSVFVSSQIDRAIIEKLPRLRLIACRSTGFNNVDLQAAHDHNVTVANVPTYGSNTVAEYAFGLLLNLTRKLPQAIAAAKSGQASLRELQGMDLHQKTFGIIGAGRIGVCVAQIAKGFGMNVVAYDKFPRDELAREYDFIYTSLEDLLKQSDVVSLHAPYTPENHHLLNAQHLALIKHGAILLNTARGELVDNQALITALESGQVSAAALDVLEGEQFIKTADELLLLRSKDIQVELLQRNLEISVLQKMPNVIVTAHNAFNTHEALQRINESTAANIVSFLQGKPENTVS